MGKTTYGIQKKLFLNVFMVLFAGVFLLSVCPTSHAQDQEGYKMAVMPFVKGKHPEKIEDTLNCTYANICFEDENIMAGADKTLTRMLYDILSTDLGDKLLPMDRVEYVYETMKINYATDTPGSFAQRLGTSLNVKYLVTGNVWRYKDKTGTSFATEKPASVAFSLYLIDIENHELLWSASYDETQQSLTENLLNALDFFKQGAKWLSAKEFAEYGMRKILKKFPEIQ